MSTTSCIQACQMECAVTHFFLFCMHHKAIVSNVNKYMTLTQLPNIFASPLLQLAHTFTWILLPLRHHYRPPLWVLRWVLWTVLPPVIHYLKSWHRPNSNFVSLNSKGRTSVLTLCTPVPYILSLKRLQLRHLSFTAYPQLLGLLHCKPKNSI